MDKMKPIIKPLDKINLTFSSESFKISDNSSDTSCPYSNYNHVDRYGFYTAACATFDNTPRDYTIYFSDNNKEKMVSCGDFSFRLTPKQYDTTVRYNKIDHGTIKNAVICEVNGTISLYDYEMSLIVNEEKQKRKVTNKDDIITIKYCGKMINVVYLGKQDILAQSGYWGSCKVKSLNGKQLKVVDLNDMISILEARHVYYIPEKNKTIIRIEPIEEQGFVGVSDVKYSIKEILTEHYKNKSTRFLFSQDCVPDPIITFDVLDTYNRRNPVFIAKSEGKDSIIFKDNARLNVYGSSGNLEKVTISDRNYLNIKTKNNKNQHIHNKLSRNISTLDQYGNKRSLDLKIISKPTKPEGK